MTTRKSPAEIRDLRQQHAKMRERDFARIHAITEAELVAAFVGQNVTRLRPDANAMLNGIAAVGEVMALTRNESAVHEKIGPYEKIVTGEHASMTLGAQIDLRIFPGKWASGFAVEKADEEGGLRRSLQFFDAAGDAVHKVHLRPASDIAAYQALVETLRADDQSQTVEISAYPPALAADAVPAGATELREHWSRLTDTHQFFGMLKKLNLSRHQAVNLIDRDYAWQLDAEAVSALMHGAAAIAVPIMVFVGNRGCIQIHSGPIEKISPMGPWLNIFDETFHLHLRLDHIAEVWAVRKPTTDGHVTSVEVYGHDKEMIIQFFGKRQEGTDERGEWRGLVEGLAHHKQTTAA